MRSLAFALFVGAASVAGASAPPSGAAEAAPSSPEASPARFDGRSVEAFLDSRAAFEDGMGDAARLAFHLRLAQVRAKLVETRGRPLTDAEFAAALDGKTLAELDAMADAAPAHLTLEIETSDDT